MKKFYASLLVLFAVASAALALNFGTAESQAAANPDYRDCSTNSIIKCGALTRSELSQKVKASSELQKLYNHFGISQQMISGGTVKNGLVYKNGNVTVGEDEIVATNAWSVGREYKAPNSEAFTVDGNKYYKRPTTNPNIFMDGEPQTAFIFFDANGKYVGTIIKNCGNPIFAEPKEQPKPAAQCVDLTVQRLSRTEYRFDARAAVQNGATVRGYVFEVRDSSGESVFKRSVSSTSTSASLTAEMTDLQPGTYRVTVAVNTSVGTKTSNKCAASFTVKAPEQPVSVQVCELKSGRIIEIDEKDFDAKLHSRDFDDCKMEVCVIEDKEVVTINRDEFDASIHTEDLSECDEEEVLGVEAPKKETPEVIASTGPVGAIGGLFGSSALGLGITSYIRSRRALSDLL